MYGTHGTWKEAASVRDGFLEAGARAIVSTNNLPSFSYHDPRTLGLNL
jgi:hypothetical protein